MTRHSSVSKVFISSTYYDLIDHRRAIFEVLLRLKLQPEAMEFFGADPEGPKQVCAAKIRDSDLFIGIYAYRYGFVPERDEKSITEQEFDLAQELGKPCFCYVVDEDHPWPPKLIERGAGADNLAAFKARLDKALVRDTFTTPSDLAVKVSTRLGRWLIEADQKIPGFVSYEKHKPPRFDPNFVPLRLIEAAKRHNLVPLIGAGISNQAIAAAPGTFPNWRNLLENLKELVLVQREGWLSSEEAKEIDQLLDRGKFLMVAEELRHRLPSDTYLSMLEAKFNPCDAKPAEIHKALLRLRPPLILTTNYDHLLEIAYASKFRKAATVLTYQDAPEAQGYLQNGRLAYPPFIFKIYGTIDKPAGIILTERDYRELIYHQPGYRLLLSAIFLTHVVLMLGFSLKDRELILLLEAMRESLSLKRSSYPDYIFLPKGAVGSVESSRLREDFGVQVISYKPSRGHPEVLEFVNYLVSQVEGDELAASPSTT